MSNNITSDNPLFQKIATLIELAHKKVATTVNLVMVHTYFEIGRAIIENEQDGKERAMYGKQILKDLSKQLIAQFGSGFSERNLRNMRQFFLAYSERNASPIWQKASAKLPVFTLSWSHYLVLMRIERHEERSFYEIEATKQNWSEPYLKRQYHSSLYERLALSRNKDAVLALATEGQMIEKPTDILKNPLTLEFLNMEEKESYTESDLENAFCFFYTYSLNIFQLYFPLGDTSKNSADRENKTSNDIKKLV